MTVTGPEAAHAALTPWANYYVITGSAAAALTGLQFVVQTLIGQRDVPTPNGSASTGGAAEHTVAAFGTPTVVHFAAALLLSAGLSAPWPSLASVRVVLVAAGVGGLAYVGVVLRRARRQTTYRPVFEDWAWHVALPAGAYGGLALAAGLARDTGAALFVVAAMTLLLLCVGIHNAWDTVAYLTAGAGSTTTPNRSLPSPAATVQPPPNPGATPGPTPARGRPQDHHAQAPRR